MSFLDDVETFKAGNPVKVSAKEVSLDPSKAKYWRGMDVVAFDKDGNRMHGTIARIYNSPLRFQFKTKEGDGGSIADVTFRIPPPGTCTACRACRSRTFLAHLC